MCMFRAGFISMYRHMNMYLHAYPLKPKHSSAEQVKKTGQHVCIYRYIYLAHGLQVPKHTGKHSTPITVCLKVLCQGRICFIPVPCF